jgi:hypothetical protein
MFVRSLFNFQRVWICWRHAKNNIEQVDRFERLTIFFILACARNPGGQSQYARRAIAYLSRGKAIGVMMEVIGRYSDVFRRTTDVWWITKLEFWRPD